MLHPLWYIGIGCILALYGIIGMWIGIYGNMHPCNHETMANITSCLPSHDFGMFIFNITYIDYNNINHQGQIKSDTVSCEAEKYNVTQTIELCYPAKHPEDFRNDEVFLRNHNVANILLITGVLCFMVP